MNTLWMLMAQYEGKPVIPVDAVARDHFDLELRVFLRKVADGKIRLPIVRMGEGQKAFRGIHLVDLAGFIDKQRADAREELNRMWN